MSLVLPTTTVRSRRLAVGVLVVAAVAAAVLVAAVVGAVLVLPAAGELPIVLGLAAAGASRGVVGALLVALPAVSLPPAVMVGRVPGLRATAAAAGATVLCALAAGGPLTALA